MAKFNWGSALGGAAGGALGAFFPSLQPYQAALSAGGGALGAAATKGNIGTGALTGLMSGGIGNTLGSGIKGAMGAQGGSLWDAFGQGAGQGWRSYMGSIPGMGGFGTSSPTGALAKMTTMAGSNGSTPGWQQPGMGSALAGFNGGESSAVNNSALAAANPQIPNYVKSVSVGMDGMPSSTQSGPMSLAAPSSLGTTGVAGAGGAAGDMVKMANQPTAGAGKNPMSMFQGALPGVGLSALGTMMSPKPKPIDLSGQLGAFQSQMATGANPEALQMGMAGAKDALAQDPALSQQEQDAITGVRTSSWQPQQQQLIGEWQAAHPGADYANDSAFSQNMAQSKSAYDAQTQEQLAAASLQKQSQVEQQKLQAVSSVLDVNSTALQAAATALGYSVDQAVNNATTDATFAQRWAQMAQSMGGTVAMGGMYSAAGKGA